MAIAVLLSHSINRQKDKLRAEHKLEAAQSGRRPWKTWRAIKVPGHDRKNVGEDCRDTERVHDGLEQVNVCRES
jgi:hypothetical protein